MPSRPYPILLIMILVITIGLSFIFPYKPRSYDTWSSYFAIENFSNGNLTISNENFQQQVIETEEGPKIRNEGQLNYTQLDDDKWAFGEAPGYPFLMVLFKKVK